MKVLILAAGRGTRISRYLSGNPKCTVDIGGECLIAYTVGLLQKKGITQIGIALGYKQEVIQKALSDFSGISYYSNPFFDITNSIASVWFARDFFKSCQGQAPSDSSSPAENEDDLLLMNGDVYMEEAVLDQILSSRRSPVLFSDETRKEEADYKFFYENHILKKYGKELSGDDITGEYIGIARISHSFLPLFCNQLDHMIASQNHSVWWENVLYELSAATPVFVEDICGKFWAEVDYIEDYERIRSYRAK